MDARCTSLELGTGLHGSNESLLTTCSGQKLDSGQSLVFSALLTSHDQSLNCYVMCDSIGEPITSLHLNGANDA
jgi:hypothetical protein